MHTGVYYKSQFDTDYVDVNYMSDKGILLSNGKKLNYTSDNLACIYYGDTISDVHKADDMHYCGTSTLIFKNMVCLNSTIKAIVENSLGVDDSQDTGECRFFDYMFAGLVIPSDFRFGKYFKTSHCVNMSAMFYGSTFKGNADLSNLKVQGECNNLFYLCKFSGDVVLPELLENSMCNGFATFSFAMFYGKVDFNNMLNVIKEYTYTFANTHFGEDFLFPDDFTLYGKRCKDVFKDAEFSDGFYLPADFMCGGGTLGLASAMYDGVLLSELVGSSDDLAIVSWLKVKNPDSSKRNENVENAISLLKNGIPVERIRIDLVGETKLTTDEIKQIMSDAYQSVYKECFEFCSDLFSYIGSYTVGDIQEKLCGKGYAKEIVDACIVDFLRNKYLEN